MHSEAVGEDWRRVAAWLQQHVGDWTSADLVRAHIDARSLKRGLEGQRLRSDVQRRFGQALGIGDDGLLRIARGEHVEPVRPESLEGRISDLEDRFARLEALVRAHLDRQAQMPAGAPVGPPRPPTS